MKVKDLFELRQGNGFELMHMSSTDEGLDVNFVSRTAQNNGVVAQVDIVESTKPFEDGSITVALGGSVLSAFVQKNPFYTSFHVMVLVPKENMTLGEKLYYCMCIKANAYKYSYGRQANKTLRELELPDIIPQWVYETSIKPITTTKLAAVDSLSSIKNWGIYSLGELFKFHKGKRLTKEDMNEGVVNFIGAISENNGVRQCIDVEPMFSPNCITVNYNGSVGEAFYQHEPFWASDDVNVLYADGWTLNRHIAMFVITIIKSSRYKFSYGRKWTLEKMKESTIKLPKALDGSPDWLYMEKYIKSLSYSDRI
ncbi:MAG: restriction endonuclease subunit S [Defluviitaleaceae bacterium]|nr:restriction endonuclease subunit S [Defluviitaleaceae bacterium]